MFPSQAASNAQQPAAQDGSHRTLQRAISRLPPHVIAQIKSSISITSFNDAVVGLLKNSLDAGATKVDISINFLRGSCIIEDDGSGILPTEFHEEGGLGQLYHTSRYNANDRVFGRTGVFLASLSALSLLSITSHHYLHHSTNSLIIHQSKCVSRQVPASRQQGLLCQKHGTRVTVRDLFGNMPVRAKHRAIALEEKSEYEKLWDRLKRSITAVLVAWNQPVRVFLQEEDKSSTLKLSGQTKLQPHLEETQKLPLGIQTTLIYLSQSSYIASNNWHTWVPVSASTSSVQVTGAISTHPSPTKRIQFISVGLQPISSESEHNELYDEINRIFNSSSFGMIDENENIVNLEDKYGRLEKSQSGDRSNRQARINRKGVDRWPMFVLWINLGHASHEDPTNLLLKSDSQLKSVIDIIRAMITQWLSAHHFRTRKARSQDRSSQQERLHDQGSGGPIRNYQSDGGLHPSNHAKRRRIGRTASRPRGMTPTQQEKNEHAKQMFKEWGRIKSGKQYLQSPIPKHLAHSLISLDQDDESDKVVESPKETPPQLLLASQPFSFCTEAVLPGSLCSAGSFNDIEANPQGSICPDGNLIANAEAPPFDSSQASMSVFFKNYEPSISVQHDASQETMGKRREVGSSSSAKTAWLDKVLSSWNNPIFKPSEKRIPQVASSRPDIADAKGISKVESLFGEASLGALNTLSKECLRNARVISQLDKKFILIQMDSSSEMKTTNVFPERLLVLIDQHAADERCRVEALLAEFCLPVSESSVVYSMDFHQTSRVKYTLLENPITYQVSAQDAEILQGQIHHFMTWGIFYSVCMPLSKSKDEILLRPTSQTTVSVKCLPPIISERCRMDPELLISFLRNEAWKQLESPSSSSRMREYNLLESTPRDSSKFKWVQYIRHCPQGILDMINSRACRSAIMFNDELTMDECETLLTRLSKCAFPFQCAHGRPSMVPLLNLGTSDDLSDQYSALKLDDHFQKNNKPTFVNMYKAWRTNI